MTSEERVLLKNAAFPVMGSGFTAVGISKRHLAVLVAMHALIMQGTPLSQVPALAIEVAKKTSDGWTPDAD